MIEDGHGIGNHSYDHPNMANLSEKGMEDEWSRFDKKLTRINRHERTIYARPPEGTFNEKLLDYREQTWLSTYFLVSCIY